MSADAGKMSSDFEKLSRLESGASTLVATEAALSPNTQCNRRPSSVSILTEDDTPVEEASGIRGFARIKDYDPRFNFHPALAIERSMVLDYQAQQIVGLGRKIQLIRRKIERNHLVDPRVAPPRYRVHRKRVMKRGLKTQQDSICVMSSSNSKDLKKLQSMMEMLGKSLAQYDATLVNSKSIESSERPQKGSLEEVKLWLSERSRDQLELYKSSDPDNFRIIGSTKGPMDKLVKTIIPVTKLGAVLLVSLYCSIQAKVVSETLSSAREYLSTDDQQKTPIRRTNSTKSEDLAFDRYEDGVLSWIVGALLLLAISVFFILPLALLSYYESDRAVRTGLVLAMCFLASLLARAIEPDEGRQIVLVCAYGALISGFLSQVS
ncbi:hypothetical protein N0V93_009712 [Gnomoniopsis smithogilvyi]|uniref:DUF6594 domain-containing protein n=1 Tax=Gnomoniopsis smithogilvyi TaxID=1191159 RepID=A0A9W8YLB7_9PEZI|nr:hypothetical protein N0V93_009712 [Gnomoniopsis smithogilvyi]